MNITAQKFIKEASEPMFMKIGFGIITYDKFYEVKILADIIKSFSKDFYVVALSNHPKGGKELARYKNIDKYLQGEDLPFKDKHGNINHQLICLRTSMNIQQCNKALVDNKKLDYCAFLHSDSWFFDIKKIYGIFKELKKKKKVLALGSIGFGLANKGQPLGNVLDMMFFYDRKGAEEHRLFEYDPFQLLPHKIDSHGSLSVIFYSRLGTDKMWLYVNPSKEYFWKSKYLTEKTANFKYGNCVRPCAIFPKYDLVHVNQSSFPGDLGYQVQAYYLQKYGMKGPTINTFIKKYELPEKELFKRVIALDKKVRGILGRHLMTYEMFGTKDYIKVLNYYKKASFGNRFMRTLRAWIWKVVKRLNIHRKLEWFYMGACEEIGQYYNNFITNPEIYKKYGHRLWYKEYKE